MRQKKDLWDEYKNFWSEFSSNKSNFIEPSLDEYSFDEKDLDDRKME